MTIEERRERDRTRKAATRANRTPERQAADKEYLRNWRKLNPGYDAVRDATPERKAWNAEYEQRPERRASRNARQNAALAALPDKEREDRNVRMRDWRKNNPEKCKRPGRTKIDCQNPLVRLIKNLRRRLHHVMADNCKSAGTLALLGCSTDQFFGHLEIRFEPGMTWENYGPMWHVDHIRPCAAFDFSDPKQQRACFNWNNLQPLWAKENLMKSSKTSECKSLTGRHL